MPGIIAAVLIVFWLLGLLAFHVSSGLIHVLLVGTTRSRVNFFLNRIRKRGFINYNGAFKKNGGLHINSSLLAAILDK